MDELGNLQRFASTCDRGGFSVEFVKCDGTNGEITKNKEPFARQVVADVPDAMHGRQKFVDNKPLYVVGRIADGWKPPPDENFDESWKPVVLLPLHDAKILKTYLFTSQSKGGRDAIANLIDALSDTYEGHPEDIGKLPICTLSSGSYVNSLGKKIFYPVFEIEAWTPRPANVRRIKPPPPDLLAIENKSQPTDGYDESEPDEAEPAPSNGIDDEIPF